MAKKTTTNKTTTNTSTKTVATGVSSKKTGAKGVSTTSSSQRAAQLSYRKIVNESMTRSAAKRAEQIRKQQTIQQQQANYYKKNGSPGVQSYISRQKALARKVGSWGSTIVFEVSSQKQITFRNFNKTHASRWKDHTIIGKKPLSEFAGPELVTVTMSCVFSAAMKVNPRKQMEALEKALEKGNVDYLYIKESKIGSNMMKLTNMSEAYDVILVNGAIVKATVDLTFSEYVTKSYKHGKKVAGTKVPWEFLVGEQPKFIGGTVYKKNNSKKGKKRGAIKVKVTKYQKGKKHPYYVKSIVDKNAAKKYTEELEALQKQLKTAKRSKKLAIQSDIAALNLAARNNKAWKGWVDEGTLKA